MASDAAAGRAAAPPFGLVLRLWLVVMAACAAAAAVVATQAADHLRDRQAALRTDRVLHVAHDLRIPLEGAVALGLPLEQAPRVQDMLEREQAGAGALSIEVFDPQGRILFGTDRSFLGDLVAERWLAAARAAGPRPWTAEDPDALVVGVPVSNSFGAIVGTVAVRHAPVARVTALDLLAPTPEARWLAGGGVLVFAGAAFLLLSRLLAGLGDELAAARRALTRPGDAPSGPVSAAAEGAALAARAAGERMDHALAEARRIDADAA